MSAGEHRRSLQLRSLAAHLQAAAPRAEGLPAWPAEPCQLALRTTLMLMQIARVERDGNGPIIVGEPALRGYKQVHNEGGVDESPWEFSGKIVSSDSSARVEFNVQMTEWVREES